MDSYKYIFDCMITNLRLSMLSYICIHSKAYDIEDLSKKFHWERPLIRGGHDSKESSVQGYLVGVKLEKGLNM